MTTNDLLLIIGDKEVLIYQLKSKIAELEAKLKEADQTDNPPE